MAPGVLILNGVIAVFVFISLHKQGYAGLFLFGWTAACFLIPFIAIPALLFVRLFVRPSPPAKEPALGSVCSRCGTSVSEAASSCPECGNHLSLS